MNTSGEAADQVIRMMLNGSEVLLKLTGSGAKNAAVLLYSILRQQKKTRGAARLAGMLRSGKPLKVYTFQDRDLQKFKDVAKQYGILFTVLKEKDRTGGVFDVMVRAEDEGKIARIIERFGLVRVDTADLRSKMIRDQAKKEKADEEPTKDQPEKNADEILAEEILEQPIQKEENAPENPTAARTEPTGQSVNTEPKGSPSGHSSIAVNTEGKSEFSEEGKSDRKPSVKKRLEEIMKRRTERTNEKAEKTPELLKGRESKPKER